MPAYPVSFLSFPIDLAPSSSESKGPSANATAPAAGGKTVQQAAGKTKPEIPPNIAFVKPWQPPADATPAVKPPFWKTVWEPVKQDGPRFI